MRDLEPAIEGENTGQRSIQLATHYTEIGRPQKCLEALQSASEELVGRLEYWTLRTLALFDLKRTDEALEAAQKGLALFPEETLLLYLLACCFQRRHALDRAEQAILAALRIEPENPSFLCRYAQILCAAGQLAKAQALLDTAEKIDPEAEEIAKVRWLLSYLQGMDRNMDEQSRKLLESNPEDSLAQALAGQAHLLNHRYRKGKRLLSLAVQANPADMDVAEVARGARVLNHWLLVPLWPMARLGPAVCWFLGAGSAIVLAMLGFEQTAGVWMVFYVVYCVYSWIVPPLVERHLSRRRL